ncbi:MAG: dephospho-CoA kinase [Microbacteriaceae bacterium]
MIHVALTGGVAAGKSVVARRLAELGARVIDADVLAREVVGPGTPGLAAIAERFGDGVIAGDGGLDRAALGAIVFADAGARADLNAIVHPAVAARRREILAGMPVGAVVVSDIPLLVETDPRAREHYDEVLVVHAGQEQRIERMTRDRRWSREEALRRIRSQASEDERLAAATTVIDNTGPLAATLREVDELWARLSRR